MNVSTLLHIKVAADHPVKLDMAKSATVCGLLGTAVMVAMPLSPLLCLAGAGALWLGFNAAYKTDRSNVLVGHENGSNHYSMPAKLAKIYNRVSKQKNPYIRSSGELARFKRLQGQKVPIELGYDAKISHLEEKAWDKMQKDTLDYIRKQRGVRKCAAGKCSL